MLNDDCDYSTNLNGGIGTIANSNDESRNEKEKYMQNNQQLNQSFSLKNIQLNNENNIEVESLMMNKHVV